MINFRFHLISLVAVFLALAVGVAMGASFVDRATVETLRDRVDALDDGYRQRGDELQSVTEQLESSDSQAAALAGEGSRALTGALAETPVVLVTGDGVPGDVVDATRSSLAAAGAIDSGTLRLQPALALSDSDVLRRTRERFGVRSRDRAEVGERVVEDLGAALALLAADPAEQTTTTAPPVGPDGAPLPTDPGAGGAPSTDTPTTAAPTTATPAGVARPTDPASARAVLEAAVELGLVAVDAGAAPAGAAFPTWPASSTSW
jgi:hypothetical protein